MDGYSVMWYGFPSLIEDYLASQSIIELLFSFFLLLLHQITALGYAE